MSLMRTKRAFRGPTAVIRAQNLPQTANFWLRDHGKASQNAARARLADIWQERGGAARVGAARVGAARGGAARVGAARARNGSAGA